MTILTPRGCSLLTLFVIVAFTASISNAQTPLSIRQRFVIFAGARACDPAVVKMFALGVQPADAILAQVTIENRSEKPIAAIWLRWLVYNEREGRNVILTSCTPNFSFPKSLLSGITDTIQLTALAPNQTSTIGINPLPVPNMVTNLVFVDRPFVRTEDVRSLVTDAEASTGRYALVIFVAQIQYSDGTTWTGGIQ